MIRKKHTIKTQIIIKKDSKKIKPKTKSEIDNFASENKKPILTPKEIFKIPNEVANANNFTENSTKQKLEVNTITPEQIKNILKELDAH